MTEVQRSLPKWILIVSGIFALLEIMVGFSLCYSPGSVADTVDLSAKGVHYLFYMWAARQFALGVIFAYSAFKKSVPMLTVTYVFFLVMFVGDLVIGILQKENSMIIAAIVMIGISSGILYALNKRK
ncbi:MAG TPA: hypothetical protein VF868_14165 [Bacteroidia bacterium]|jgi:hypothetical protein